MQSFRASSSVLFVAYGLVLDVGDGDRTVGQ